MQKIKDLKIGTRLGFGFALVLLFTAAIAVIGILRMSAIKSDFNDLVQKGNARTATAIAMRAELQKIFISVRNMMIYKDSSILQKQKEDIVEARRRYDELEKKLELLLITEKGKKIFSEITASRDATRQQFSKIIELAQSGKNEEAVKLLQNEARTLQEKWFAAIQSMIDRQEELTQQLVVDTESSYKSGFIIMAILSVSAILLGVIIAVFVTRSIVRPLSYGVQIANSLASGDLRINVDIESKDETGQLMLAMKTMTENLRGTIGHIESNSTQVASAANQLQSTAEQIATGAEEVAAQAGTVATAGEEMSATSSDIARNCQMAAEGAKLASQTAQTGSEVVAKTVTVMGEIAEKVQEAAKTIDSLGVRSDQIGEIIGTIEEIADQTNLLALNAAIEAARAGEQGRGFAVVADEVRALAERTTRATKEIGEMIKAIQRETKGAVAAMEKGVEQVEFGTIEASRSGEALKEILQQINDVAMQVSQIATAAEEQTATTGEIANNMQQITAVVLETSQGAHESATAATQLSGNAEELQRLVHQFKL